MSPPNTFSTLGIKARVLILAVLPVAVVAVWLGYKLATSRLHDVEHGLAERGSLIARNLALASEFSLLSQNAPLLNDTLQQLADETEVDWVGIWDPERRVFMTGGAAPDGAKTRKIVEAIENQATLPADCFYEPIVVSGIPVTDFNEEYSPSRDAASQGAGQLLGFAVVDMSRTRTDIRKAEILNESLLITLAGLIGSALLAILIGNGISRPITRLIGAVRELASGNLKARIPPSGGGEIGDLEVGINRMAAALEDTQVDLERQIEDATTALRDTVLTLETRNQELEQARQIALHAGQERTEFLARMSHEIRTPLNAIIGFAKLLQSDIRPETRDEHLRTIRGAADQLLHVINDILQFIRLDAGADRIEELPFSIGDLLEDAVTMLGQMAHEKGLDLALILHSDLPQQMLGDPTRLSQAIVNLLNNAIKFTQQGHVVVEASLIATADGPDQIEITVTDSGIGLDEEEQTSIFGAFAQSDSSITRRFGGTGLGLAITKRLCELMGGEIHLRSTKGEGAQFSIRIPCTDCSARGDIRAPFPEGPRRVLVYDQNPFVRRSLRAVLTAWGIQVFNSGRWKQMLQLVDPNHQPAPFDCVIFGLSHAEQSPENTQQRLSELRSHYRGRIIVLTRFDNWLPPAPLAADPNLSWTAKPARRNTLQRLLRVPQEEGSAPAALSDAGSHRTRLAGMQILVAEDNNLNRQLLRFLLQEEGASVDEALTGTAAVTAAAGGAYEAILMDLHMPEMDGGQAALQIREQLRENTPPMVLLTADVFRQDNLPDAAGCFDHRLLKPVDPETLVDLLLRLREGKSEPQPASARWHERPNRTLPKALRERYVDEIDRLVTFLLEQLSEPEGAATAETLHDLRGIAGMFGDASLNALSRQLSPETIRDNPVYAIEILMQLRNKAQLASDGAVHGLEPG